mmetsp:Transcript_3584/g.6279  ORF Transcript_3584/g.6279 Transcript_3584/m.6279 type:complete len:265 (-) Transcript_3584:307-1101(-)
MILDLLFSSFRAPFLVHDLHLDLSVHLSSSSHSPSHLFYPAAFCGSTREDLHHAVHHPNLSSHHHHQHSHSLHSMAQQLSLHSNPNPWPSLLLLRYPSPPIPSQSSPLPLELEHLSSTHPLVLNLHFAHWSTLSSVLSYCSNQSHSQTTPSLLQESEEVQTHAHLEIPRLPWTQILLDVTQEVVHVAHYSNQLLPNDVDCFHQQQQQEELSFATNPTLRADCYDYNYDSFLQLVQLSFHSNPSLDPFDVLFHQIHRFQNEIHHH